MGFAQPAGPVENFHKDPALRDFVQLDEIRTRATGEQWPETTFLGRKWPEIAAISGSVNQLETLSWDTWPQSGVVRLRTGAGPVRSGRLGGSSLRSPKRVDLPGLCRHFPDATRNAASESGQGRKKMGWIGMPPAPWGPTAADTGIRCEK